MRPDGAGGRQLGVGVLGVGVLVGGEAVRGDRAPRRRSTGRREALRGVEVQAGEPFASGVGQIGGGTRHGSSPGRVQNG